MYIIISSVVPKKRRRKNQYSSLSAGRLFNLHGPQKNKQFYLFNIITFQIIIIYCAFWMGRWTPNERRKTKLSKSNQIFGFSLNPIYLGQHKYFKLICCLLLGISLHFCLFFIETMFSMHSSVHCVHFKFHYDLNYYNLTYINLPKFIHCSYL